MLVSRVFPLTTPFLQRSFSKQITFPPTPELLDFLQKYPFPERNFFNENRRTFDMLATHFGNITVINSNQVGRETYRIFCSNDIFFKHHHTTLSDYTKQFSEPLLKYLEDTYDNSK